MGPVLNSPWDFLICLNAYLQEIRERKCNFYSISILFLFFLGLLINEFLFYFHRFLGFGRLCVDLRRDCKQHAANGACTNKWASYMAKNCGKSCKAAGVEVRCDEQGMKPKGECTNPLGMYFFLSFIFFRKLCVSYSDPKIGGYNSYMPNNHHLSSQDFRF